MLKATIGPQDQDEHVESCGGLRTRAVAIGKERTEWDELLVLEVKGNASQSDTPHPNRHGDRQMTA